MPELPEVETVRKGLENKMLHGVVSSLELRREGLRYPFPIGFSDSVVGRTIVSIDRRAKYLLIRMSDGLTWIVHLGMTGKFTLYQNDSELESVGGFAKHDHVVIKLESGVIAIYNDPRRFGFMDLIDTDGEQNHRHLANIGCEPLSDDFHAQALAFELKGKKTPIKTALLDQRIVAGLGNIYVCEILYRAKISPKRSAKYVAGANQQVSHRCENIVSHTKDVLREAIIAGGSTISDFAAVDGDLGYFAHSFRVYGREGEVCLGEKCEGVVKRITQAGRSTFYCPQCQK